MDDFLVDLHSGLVMLQLRLGRLPAAVVDDVAQGSGRHSVVELACSLSISSANSSHFSRSTSSFSSLVTVVRPSRYEFGDFRGEHLYRRGALFE